MSGNPSRADRPAHGCSRGQVAERHEHVAPQDAQDQQVKKDLTLSPFSDEGMFLGITVPEGFPIIGGDKFKLWEPNWPVTVAFDPFGFLRVKGSTPSESRLQRPRNYRPLEYDTEA